MAAQYAQVLRARHAARLLAGTLVGRLPNATAPLTLVLFTRAEGGSYGLAGAFSAVYGVCNAVGQPVLGRAVDRRGQPAVMLPAALLSALGMTGYAVVGLAVPWLAFAAVVVAGFCTPPLEGGLRALWPDVLRRQERVHAAYALDAVAQEVMFAVGPLLVTACVAAWSERAALWVINLLGVLGAASVLLSGPSRRWRGAERSAHWLGALRSPGMRVLVAAFFFVGVALGSISVAAVAYAGEVEVTGASSYLLSALGVGALLGGIAYGARSWPGTPEGRLRVLVGLLALGYLPLTLVPGVVWMTVLAGLAGLFLAPALACAFVVVDRHAPVGTVTEAFSWLVTTFGVGSAAGMSVVGPAVEYGGARAGFAVAGLGGLAALGAMAVTRGFLAAPVPARPAGVSGENDRNRPADAGFKARHQA